MSYGNSNDNATEDNVETQTNNGEVDPRDAFKANGPDWMANKITSLNERVAELKKQETKLTSESYAARTQLQAFKERVVQVVVDSKVFRDQEERIDFLAELDLEFPRTQYEVTVRFSVIGTVDESDVASAVESAVQDIDGEDVYVEECECQED